MDRMFAVKRASCFFTFTNGVAFLLFYLFTFRLLFYFFTFLLFYH